AEAALGRDRAAVPPDDPFDGRQPDAGAFELVAAMQARGRTEQLAGLFRIEADSVVADEVRNRITRSLVHTDRDVRLRPGLGVLERIAEKILHDEAEQPRVAPCKQPVSDFP